MATGPLQGEKILVTGATGAAALPVAKFLARDNEVFGAARFTDPRLREELENAGVKIARIDLESNDLEAIPDDISIVLHYAYTRRPSHEFYDAIQVNSIAAGHVLKKCQNARAALIISAATLYSVHEDPYHPYHEDDDIGFVRAPWGPSSPVSKVTLESTARFCAEAFDLPITIVRPSVPYGLSVDMTTVVLDAVWNETPVFANHAPQPYSLIHIGDMCDQIPALLEAASVPATLVNWASDEVFSLQEMAALAGEIFGKTPIFQISNLPGVANGGVVDTTRVRKIVGPCKRSFRDEFVRACKARVSA